MRPRILCTIGDAFVEKGKTVLATAGTVDYRTPTQAEFRSMIGRYDACVLQLGLQIDAAVLRKAKRLRYIATATTGTDHIDLSAAKRAGITVLSLRGADVLRTIPSTAEHAWGLLLALLRHTVPAADTVAHGVWDGRPFTGTELRGKTLGILGVGRLGTMVARYGKAFGMNVLGCDVRKLPRSLCRQVSLNELLRRSDMVSIHVHLDERTEGMIGTRELARMKPSAVLINTARGKIVDERALLSALRRKRLAGYAADVLSGESRFAVDCARDPLVRFAHTHGNVLLTPHIGGRTAEARTATDVWIAERLRDALHSRTKRA